MRVVRRLGGGQHAETFEVAAGSERLVFRRFPAGDDAVLRERTVLSKLASLGGSCPQLVAADTSASSPRILTSYVPGAPPDPGLDPAVLAAELGRTLARVHEQDAGGLPSGVPFPPIGAGPCAREIKRRWSDLDMSELVFTHGDFWSGNTVWDGVRLTGVVDWSGAHRAPRGIDLAWCRQDLALLHGRGDAPDVFLAAYDDAAGVKIRRMRLWDLHAGARAEDRVEEWAPNYEGVARPDLTGERLRARLDAWNDHLLRG
ncbi:phosphotransferase family protein [Spelaeicoccus albus]|nr:phosphotransferase [Spelaeicoccus albus]